MANAEKKFKGLWVFFDEGHFDDDGGYTTVTNLNGLEGWDTLEEAEAYLAAHPESWDPEVADLSEVYSDEETYWVVGNKLKAKTS